MLAADDVEPRVVVALDSAHSEALLVFGVLGAEAVLEEGFLILEGEGANQVDCHAFEDIREGEGVHVPLRDDRANGFDG